MKHAAARCFIDSQLVRNFSTLMSFPDFCKQCFLVVVFQHLTNLSNENIFSNKFFQCLNLVFQLLRIFTEIRGLQRLIRFCWDIQSSCKNQAFCTCRLQCSWNFPKKLSKSSSKARQSIILGYLTNANTILECVLILLLHYIVPQVAFLRPAGRIHTIPNTLSRYQFSACHVSETAIRTSRHWLQHRKTTLRNGKTIPCQQQKCSKRRRRKGGEEEMKQLWIVSSVIFKNSLKRRPFRKQWINSISSSLMGVARRYSWLKRMCIDMPLFC